MPSDTHVHVTRLLDLRGEVCPYTFVKSKLAIEELALGEVLEVLLDNREGADNVPRSFQDHGQEVLSREQLGAREWRVRVRKTRED
ncbi:MAG: sulfurtransferase TusA family protein [Planctomycetes bacterium]|nr:sulfurtransferase TusA family protein [Planctomycetota bacterium]